MKLARTLAVAPGLIALALFLTLMTGLAQVADAAGYDYTPPCRYEDGSSQDRCVWDAKHMGNGRGQSVLIIDGGDWNAKYLDITHRRAHRLMTTNR